MTNETEATPNATEDTLVNQMAAPILADFKRKKKFGARNRSSWKRMNRPSQVEKREKGASFLMAFFERCQPKKPMESTETI